MSWPTCLIFILLSLTIVSESFSYVASRTRGGAKTKWNLASGSQIQIFANASNEQFISSNSVQNILQSSIDSWNGKSSVSIARNPSAGKNQTGVNEFFFSKDPEIFSGTKVLGITQVRSVEATGEIIEADIMLNDSVQFSTNSLESFYLGNVISHELGHFLGLGHGQVLGSTMFYSIAKGQSSVDPDDAAGLYSLYPYSNSAIGKISGTVVGGKNLLPVFAAHVQAISVSKAKVVASALSELNGTFSIEGLPRDDQYVLYIAPSNPAGLSNSYANLRTDFCENSKSFRGSFFQSCGASAEGFPQVINLGLADPQVVDVGRVTIRCSLDSPPEYLDKKNLTPNTFDAVASADEDWGVSFVGVFSSRDLVNKSQKDYFWLNLTGADYSQLDFNKSYYLEVKIINQAFYSAFKANLAIKVQGVTTTATPKYVQGVDGWVNIESSLKVPLNVLDPSANSFEVSILPETMEFPYYPTSLPFEKIDLFPDFYEYQDSLYFYLVIAHVSEDKGGGILSPILLKKRTITDNSSCPDAANTYALNSYGVNGTSDSSSERKKVISCASVEMHDGNGSGPGGFFVGFVLCLLISFVLTRYGKMT